MNSVLLRRRSAYYLRRLGWQGLSGLTLIIAALVFASIAYTSANNRSERLERQLVEASARLKQAEADPATRKPTTPTEQLLAFYQEFPKGASVPDWLEKIYAIADEQKLALDVGEYTLSKAQAGRLDQFRIAFPLKGTYPQIRKFITAALSTAPALALDGLYLKRDKVSEATVDARIVFLLYLEKGA